MPMCWAGPMKDLGRVVASQEKKRWPNTAHKPMDYSCRAVHVVSCHVVLCYWIVPMGCASGSCQWAVPAGHANGPCLWVVPVGRVSGSCQWAVLVGCANGPC